jgi:ABC-2 type transport system permease protein
MEDASEIQFKERSEETQMIIISDGDFIKNKYNKKTNEYYALGFDRNKNQTYANKEFFLNAVNYLVDESGLILSNTKSFKIRLLNAQKINNNKALIQLINTVLPIILIMLIGIILNFIRKRKYTVK